ncbi:MAG: Golgi transport complex subunit 6 [Geoglossum umbratile]|nr:MAG: Golgi transport complex subunit 6 [Geoglossum umbratile]
MASSYFRERPAGSPIDRLDALSPASSPSTSVPRASALSNKITSVLSASYADLEIRDALETLDERGIENTPETRRWLRLDVQKEVIQCNGEIISEFGRIAEQVKRIGEVIASLNRCCEEMKEAVSAAHQETAPVLEEASSLLGRKQEVETKQRLLEAFNKHFTVPGEDLLVLTSSAEPVNDEFFTVLARVKKIHRDCQVLLGAENQRLGLEIMEQSSRDLNTAFQKLYRWTQREFKTLNLENPQISSAIRRALRALAERPSLFQSCLDYFAEAREHILSDSFHAALTGVSSTGDHPSAKPIELFAHDPLRYLGDMLAWTHSATVSEREALEVLFISDGDEIAKGIQAGIDSEPWSRPDGEGTEVFDGRKALDGLVNRDLAGVARVLRQRVEQVTQGHEEPTLTYRIANLINFYLVTFTKLLGQESSILATLAELEESALHQFRSTLKDRIIAVQTDPPPAPTDLKPPEFLTEALDQLKTLMKTFETSLTPASTREVVFKPILEAALEPYLEICETLVKDLGEPAGAILTLNILNVSKAALAPFSFTAEKATELDDTTEELEAKLVSHQHVFFQHNSGLHPLLTALAPPMPPLPDLPALPALQPPALIATSQTLDDFLPSALMDAIENLKFLQDSDTVRAVTGEAAERFCEDFEFVERRIVELDELLVAQNGEDADEGGGLRALFPRTGAEIRVLLS